MTNPSFLSPAANNAPQFMGGTGDPPVPAGDSPAATLFVLVPVLELVPVLVVVLALDSSLCFLA